ncbi:MAG: hypothetical protein AB8G23_07970 [Myxococcota bacterium]
MEAVFFRATSEAATRIRSADDLEGEWVGEPLVVGSPGVIAALARAAGLGNGPAIETLRDATCQSFPVWIVSADLERGFSSLNESLVDDWADRWLAEAAEGQLSEDAYALSTWLLEMQEALQEPGENGQRLFVLFEEKAMA